MRSEFQINIRGIRQSRKTIHKDLAKEPAIRQYLVLAEQIKKVLEKIPKRSMRDISKWLGFSPARLSQIFKLTFLAPQIKEEILLSNKQHIYTTTITTACNVAGELSWKRQMDLWQSPKNLI